MRVLFLTLYPETAASPRYRVHQFIPYLKSRGVECTVACPLTEREYDGLRAGQTSFAAYHAKEFMHRVGHVLSARDFDVVYLQKAITTAPVRGMLGVVRRFSRRLVYDIDDAVHLAPPVSLSFPWKLAEDDAQNAKLMRVADCVAAGNAWLAEETASRGGRATVAPTAVDTDRFRPGDAARQGFHVGWIGSQSTSDNLAVIGDVIRELPDDVGVTAIGPTAAVPNLPRVAVRPWRLETEVEEVQRFDVGLMPLEKTEWNRGKCALKALQYMACGVPCVATPFGAVTDIIEDGVNGLLADSDGAWRDALDRLKDPAERRRLGTAGRETVEDRFSLRAIAPQIFELLEQTV